MSGDTPFEPTGDEIFFSWTDQDGNKHEDCVEETILAKLLVDEVLFVGDFDSGPFFRTEKGEKFSTVCVWVGCNDTFGWACADAEPISIKELPELYALHKEDPIYGSTKWVCKKRNLQPQGPLIKRMKERGAWDEMMESLPKNKV